MTELAVVSLARPTSLVGAMLGVYAPLMGLLWFWLTVRALVVDRRAAWVRLVVVCVLGAPCWTGVIALFAAGVFTSISERLPDGLSAVVGALGGAMLGFMFVEAVANPTFKDRRGRYRSYFDARSPSLSGRWPRPALILCRWGLGGVGLGSLGLGVAFSLARNPDVALDSSRLPPGYLALGLALALALVGLIKVIARDDAEEGRGH